MSAVAHTGSRLANRSRAPCPHPECRPGPSAETLRASSAVTFVSLFSSPRFPLYSGVSSGGVHREGGSGGDETSVLTEVTRPSVLAGQGNTRPRLGGKWCLAQGCCDEPIAPVRHEPDRDTGADQCGPWEQAAHTVRLGSPAAVASQAGNTSEARAGAPSQAQTQQRESVPRGRRPEVVVVTRVRACASAMCMPFAGRAAGAAALRRQDVDV